MARYRDGLKQATCLFEAAAWHYAVKVSCGCGHFASFDPHGLFWRFHCRGWPDDFRAVRAKMWCRACRQSLGQKVRPRRLDLVQPYPRDMITLTQPDEREWKRILNRYRG